jgi:hypothetical protein
MGLDPRRPVRAAASCWLTYGKLGTPSIPHVFVAARCNWALDKQRMRLIDAELAIIQTVPDGRLTTFIDHLHSFNERIKEKKPVRQLLLADLTRSMEVCPALWRKLPDAIPVLVTPAPRDEWSFPFRVCGRPLLLSRLQLWISDQKLVSALGQPADDPNLWAWDRLREAIAATVMKPARLDPTAMGFMDDSTEDDVVLGIAQIPWWAEMEEPSPYADTLPVKRVMGK